MGTRRKGSRGDGLYPPILRRKARAGRMCGNVHGARRWATSKRQSIRRRSEGTTTNQIEGDANSGNNYAHQALHTGAVYTILRCAEGDGPQYGGDFLNTPHHHALQWGNRT